MSFSVQMMSPLMVNLIYFAWTRCSGNVRLLCRVKSNSVCLFWCFYSSASLVDGGCLVRGNPRHSLQWCLQTSIQNDTTAPV